MGADIKALRSRIKSVESTMHLTKAMGLVASSKIRHASISAENSRAYRDSLLDVMNTLLSCRECRRSPYLRRSGTRLKLIVVAGDRGMAGGYNSNVFRLASQYEADELIPVGKRACERYSLPSISAESFSVQEAHKLSQRLCKEFLDGEYDLLGIVSTRYLSMLKQEAVFTPILPLELPEVKAGTAIFEPDETAILDAAVPIYVSGMMLNAVREGFLCEVASRRVAMDNAGKNASALTDELKLEYNRARQSSITQEITEIVAGSTY